MKTNIPKTALLLVLFALLAISEVRGQADSAKMADSVEWYNNQLKINFAKAQLSDYQYHIYTNRHATAVYNLHHRLSMWIFVLVIIIVLTGLAFSGIQFLISLKTANKKIALHESLHLKDASKQEEKKTSNNKEEEALSRTTLKFGKDGIEVSSSILGVIVLAMSIIFFYMYLHYVYPVVEISKEVATEQK